MVQMFSQSVAPQTPTHKHPECLLRTNTGFPERSVALGTWSLSDLGQISGPFYAFLVNLKELIIAGICRDVRRVTQIKDRRW